VGPYPQAATCFHGGVLRRREDSYADNSFSA
jgi:hypothetical protein